MDGDRELPARMGPSVVDPTSVFGEELAGTAAGIGSEEPIGSASNDSGLGGDLEKSGLLGRIDTGLRVATKTAVRPTLEAEALEQVKIDLYAGVVGSGAPDGSFCQGSMKGQRTVLRSSLPFTRGPVPPRSLRGFFQYCVRSYLLGSAPGVSYISIWLSSGSRMYATRKFGVTIIGPS